MINEELNTALYQKMFAEQEQFKSWLLTLPPNEILQHCYEYTCREDILLSLEYNELSDKQAKALLKSPTPLADVFKNWETGHMQDIRECTESRANEVVRADFLAAQRDSR